MSGTPYPKLKSTDLMAWGKYKGQPLGNLSNSYLLFLHAQPWVKENHPALYEYILDALPVLREKNP